MQEETSGTSEASSGGRRTRMVRSYPTHPLDEALAVAGAIQESNAGLPFERVVLARALGTTPASSGFTMRLNSSARYGLTQGGYNDSLIRLTSRGEALVAPKDDDELRKALVEAAMHPDVFGRFYRMLDGKRLPEDTYAKNMLHRELGIHPDLAGECLDVIKANGLYVDVIRQIEGALYVGLHPAKGAASDAAGVGAVRDERGALVAAGTRHDDPSDAGQPLGVRVFTAYVGSREIIQAVRGLLDEFEIPYAAADGDGPSTGPVSPETAAEIRSCTAAIFVFAKESKRGDRDSAGVSGEQLLYQLGAASVLYGGKIVLVKELGLDLDLDLGALPTVDFDPEKPKEAGLDLLRQLRTAGVIALVA